MTSLIQFLIGDAAHPLGNGNKIIAHVCNDGGRWGNGFMLALSKRWRRPRDEFLLLHSRRALRLGAVQLVRVEKNIWVANLIAQHDTGVAPIRYDALLECIKQLGFEAHQRQASLHLPRSGGELAGGNWEKVERLLTDWLPGTQIYVYDPPAT